MFYFLPLFFIPCPPVEKDKNPQTRLLLPKYFPRIHPHAKWMAITSSWTLLCPARPGSRGLCRRPWQPVPSSPSPLDHSSCQWLWSAKAGERRREGRRGCRSTRTSPLLLLEGLVLVVELLVHLLGCLERLGLSTCCLDVSIVLGESAGEYSRHANLVCRRHPSCLAGWEGYQREVDCLGSWTGVRLGRLAKRVVDGMLTRKKNASGEGPSSSSKSPMRVGPLPDWALVPPSQYPSTSPLSIRQADPTDSAKQRPCLA